MAILGTLLKKGIRLRESLEQQYTSKEDLQKNELRKLLIHARQTSFGKKFGFAFILNILNLGIIDTMRSLKSRFLFSITIKYSMNGGVGRRMVSVMFVGLIR